MILGSRFLCDHCHKKNSTLPATSLRTFSRINYSNRTDRTERVAFAAISTEERSENATLSVLSSLFQSYPISLFPNMRTNRIPQKLRTSSHLFIIMCRKALVCNIHLGQPLMSISRVEIPGERKPLFV